MTESKLHWHDGYRRHAVRTSYRVYGWLALCLLALVAPSGLAQEQTWRINVKNADLNEFVVQVAEITGRTFVVDPRIKGNVTVISNTPMDRDAVYELFLSVLRVHNWTAVPSGGVIRIQQNATAKQSPGAEGDLSAVAPEELVTRVVAAQNVDSGELVKILRPLIPQYGHIAAVANPNVVIISDHADNIVRLVRLVQQIDVSDEDEVVVVPLRDAWVGTVVAMLEKVAPDQLARGAVGPQRIQLIANERNNSLVVRGKPRPVAQILKLVERLDQPATASGATQVIYLRHGEAAKLAPLLEGLITQNTTGSEEGRAPTTIRADESLNAIIVRGDPAIMAELRDILDKLDIRRTQVLIEAAIVEVSVDENTRIGVEMAGVDASGGSLPFGSTTLDGVISALLGNIVGEDGSVDVLSGLASISSPTLAVAKINPDGLSFAAVVRALATNTNANLLSTPSILTLDNQEAKIVVGNEVPFRTGSFTTTGDGSNNPFTTIQRQDVGLQLTVTPHIQDGTTVRLVVAQEVTNVVDTAIGDAAFSDVVTSKRTIETTVLADDRQTIVLGGLIQDDLTDSLKKVPLLGDIPGLGRLFRSTNKTLTKRNLLVFLRPTVIRNQDDAREVTERKYQDVWEVEITSSGTVTPEDLFRGRP
ncbi:MAG: type II secretion system secretin GspD [Pseudomonadales bacterium]|nr:type II secretion system secretin GspD [Pseudomonadales bacterium]